MSEKAKLLLERLERAYDKSGQVDFDSFFYTGNGDEVLNELEANGYIVVAHDIVGTIRLIRP